ncbi:MAG: amidohydrolase family protein [Stellaceae bacterium]
MADPAQDALRSALSRAGGRSPSFISPIPYIETCIEAFGPQRSMFESNFPVDKGTCSYQVLWNTFKRIAAGYSAEEKTALFSGTAAKAYRLTL